MASLKLLGRSAPTPRRDTGAWRRLGNISLRSKLILASLAVSVIPLAGISYLAGLATRQALVNAANQSLAGAAAQTAASLDGFVRANLDAARIEAQVPAFSHFLQLPSGQRASQAAEAQGLLLVFSRHDPLYLTDYAVLDASGHEVMNSSQATVGEITSGPDQSQRDYFRIPWNSTLPYASPVELAPDTGTPAIYFSAPIRDDAGHLVGVLAIGYRASILQHLIDQASGLAGQGSFAVVLDENHIRLADGAQPADNMQTVMLLAPAQVAALQAAHRLPAAAPLQNFTNLPAFERGLANASQQPFFLAQLHPDDLSPQAVAVVSMTAQPWLVVFAQAENVFLEPVQQQTRTALIIGGILAALVVLAAAGTARLLAGPIVRLTAVAELVGAGDLETQAAVEANDEIGRLAQTFNAMTVQLRQTLAGLADRTAELALTNERLQAELAERQRGEAALRESEARQRALLEAIPDTMFRADPSGTLLDFKAGAGHLLGAAFGKYVGQSVLAQASAEVHLPSAVVTTAAEHARRALETGQVQTYQSQASTAAGIIHTETRVVPSGQHEVIGIVRDITDRVRAEAAIHNHAARAEALARTAARLNAELDLQAVLAAVCEETRRALDMPTVTVSLYDAERDELAYAGGAGVPPGYRDGAAVERRAEFETPGAGPVAVIADVRAQPQTRLAARLAALGARTLVSASLRRKGELIGALYLVTYAETRTFEPGELGLLQSLADLAVQAITNARLFAAAQRRLRHTEALRKIDTTITGSFDLGLMLRTVLDEVIGQLGVDAADILLPDPQTQQLAFSAGRGLLTQTLQTTSQRLDAGHPGRAVTERRTIRVTDLGQANRAAGRTQTLAGEGFVAYFAVPLISKGVVTGVLELFHRTPLAPDSEWLSFLDALAGQAAIAIDSVTLFSGLQRSHAELAAAYETTLEGWSRALDLRDKETEGHTQRVTEMTLRLARAMDLGPDELLQMRRGALLHDIGKMGIPDSILLKPGPLTDAEWTIMIRHPTYAYELLSPIAYLRGALDIPYCHHERWDGSGYPRGLRAEQIPLAARIFAVVDVWDALRSDRPYRTGWPEAQVRDHIRVRASVDFDPRVVEVFMRLIHEPSPGEAALPAKRL